MKRWHGIAVLLGVAMNGLTGAETHWWSLKPLQPTPVPKIAGVNSHWGRNPIDAFVLQTLQTNQLAPAPEADRRTQLRRVTFDLTGLPPTPGETLAFLKDPRPDAYERVVDNLLSSPRYGERWARHWMDAAHFAETHGHDQDRIRTNAWPYRDYLISSFNRDTPYARFVNEQIAADALHPESPGAIPALGFIAAGPWDESSLRDIREDTLDRQIGRYLDRDDMVTTVMSTFASVTVHCARCHDHKFDPVSQADYYSLQAVFAGVDRANRVFDTDPEVHQKRQALMRERRALKAREPWVLERIASLEFQKLVRGWASSQPVETAPPSKIDKDKEKDKDKAKEKEKDPVAQILAKPESTRRSDEVLELASHVWKQQIEDRLRLLPQPSYAYAAASDFIPDGSMVPGSKPRTVHVLKRGDVLKPGAEASPGSLTCVTWLPSRFQGFETKDESTRRAELALWLTHPKNPLSWRSIVNRVWHHHFGRGIVETPNDFGRMGSLPTHPELLDWLAVWFRDQNGSFKNLHRLILTSSVYRQNASGNELSLARAEQLDIDNRLLWRMSRSRLDAESIRDAILQFTGRLDLRMGGPSDRQFDIKPGIHVTPVVDYSKFDVDADAGRRRGIYRFLFRTLPDPMMDALDCPAGDQLTPVRNASVTVQHALSMWNNVFLLRHAEHIASLVAHDKSDEPNQINRLFEIILNRPPSNTERVDVARYSHEHGLANVCRLLLNSNEFMFVN